MPVSIIHRTPLAREGMRFVMMTTLVLLFFASQTVFAQLASDIEYDIVVTAYFGSDSTFVETLTIAYDPSAVDEISATDDYDEVSPPLPPGFGTALDNPDDGAALLGITDARLDDTGAENYDLVVALDSEPGTEVEPDSVSFSWDAFSDPQIVDATLYDPAGPGGGSPCFEPIDLTTSGSVTLGSDSPFGCYPDAFDLFIVVELGEPLPIELSRFAVGAAEAGRVALEWETASEINNAGFDVERSLDGTKYESLGFVEGKGTTLEPSRYRFVDARIPANAPKLYYRLKQTDFDGKSSYSPTLEVLSPVPSEFKLHGAYPNPFNPSTQISYELPEAHRVTLAVYDALGRVVRTLVDTDQAAGIYSVPFNAAGLPSGLYLYRFQAGSFNQTGRMLLVK